MATKKKIKLALIGTDLVFLASDPETNRMIGLRALEQGFRAIELARDSVEIAKKILKARSA
jgi:hypothetical protein